jgi:hypothetical protein
MDADGLLLFLFPPNVLDQVLQFLQSQVYLAGLVGAFAVEVVFPGLQVRCEAVVRVGVLIDRVRVVARE